MIGKMSRKKFDLTPTLGRAPGATRPRLGNPKFFFCEFPITWVRKWGNHKKSTGSNLFWSRNSHFSRSLSSWQGLRKYFKVFFSFFCHWDPVGLFLVNYIYFGFVSVRVAEIDA